MEPIISEEMRRILKDYFRMRDASDKHFIENFPKIKYDPEKYKFNVIKRVE